MKSIFALCCATSLLGGCAILRTEPWQKATLAQQQMQLNPSPLLRSCDEHIYFSREGTAGGRGFSGGGCGCN